MGIVGELNRIRKQGRELGLNPGVTRVDEQLLNPYKYSTEDRGQEKRQAWAIGFLEGCRDRLEAEQAAPPQQGPRADLVLARELLTCTTLSRVQQLARQYLLEHG